MRTYRVGRFAFQRKNQLKCWGAPTRIWCSRRFKMRQTNEERKDKNGRYLQNETIPSHDSSGCDGSGADQLWKNSDYAGRKTGAAFGDAAIYHADNTVLIFMQFPTPGKRWRESSSLIQVIIGPAKSNFKMGTRLYICMAAHPIMMIPKSFMWICVHMPSVLNWTSVRRSRYRLIN